MKKGQKEIYAAFTMGWAGNIRLISNLAIPFLKEVEERLLELGFDETLKKFDVPESIVPTRVKHRMKKSASEVVTALVISISIFLGTSIGSWAISKVCDIIFDKKIKFSWHRLRTKFRCKIKNNKMIEPIRIKLGVWYDVNRVYILVIAELSNPADFAILEELIKKAHHAALEWIEKHGVTGQVLTYRIRHGELSQQPQISENKPTI